MSKIKAVVFDIDGVLIDSKLLITEAIKDVLATRGLAVSAEQMAAVAGQPIAAMYKSFAPALDAAELEREHVAHNELHLDLLRAHNGAAEVLDKLSKEYKIAAFTGLNALARQRLALFGLDSYFPSIIDSTRYTHHKPDPEGLLLALDEVGVAADVAIYVGDAKNDVGAGKAAGVCAVIGITHGFSTRADLEDAGADYIIDSLSDLPAVIGKIEQN
jgi:HAD superfamily hydrolase (TIGR01509 family)